jgi:hypothetical protein
MWPKLAGDCGADGFAPSCCCAVAHAPAEHVVGHFAVVGAIVFGEICVDCVDTMRRDVGQLGVGCGLYASSHRSMALCLIDK